MSAGIYFCAADAAAAVTLFFLENSFPLFVPQKILVDNSGIHLGFLLKDISTLSKGNI